MRPSWGRGGLKTQYEHFCFGLCTQCASNDPKLEQGQSCQSGGWNEGGQTGCWLCLLVLHVKDSHGKEENHSFLYRGNQCKAYWSFNPITHTSQPASWNTGDVFCPKMPNTKAIIVNLSGDDRGRHCDRTFFPILIKHEILFAPDVALFDVLFWWRKLCRCPPLLRSFQMMKRVRARGPSGVRLSHGA